MGGATTGQSSAASNKPTRGTIAQYNADADLLAQFEQSDAPGKSFDYTRSVLSAPNSVSEEKISAYLCTIQRGGHIQSFGCMLALEDPTLRVIGYSENCFDLLGLGSGPGSESWQGGTLIGADVRALFTPPTSASLAMAAASPDLSLSNPVWVYTRTTRKPFYAILHRIDVGIVVDLEPAKFDDPALSLACAVQSQKLAVRAISRLQSLPGSDIGVLCDSVAEDVQKLTGYDRVMVYKFHDDDHGEVVSEVRRSDLEPYLGLHYPATDIPQAARFLFKQNRVRIICDCHANPVKIIQSEELKQPLCLVNSTLRSPHACHNKYMVNMGSIASLAMAVVVNGKDSSKLWGLVVCHHISSRYVPFPLRHACEFLMQAFSLQLNMELQMAALLAEKKILKMQTLLCDLLLRDAPLSIVTQSPSIMDLVKCDGAALYYEGKCWLLGVTPTELQVKDIVEWLLSSHGDSTGLTTDSLAGAGYPGATLLGNAVCGMAAAKITSKDFLFWFRSHAEKEMRWGGAKHHPDKKDDGGRMHPRSSFNAFLEVVKSHSLPWGVPEINAIQSLQLILRQSFHDKEESGTKGITYALRGNTDMQSFGELGSVACEMVRLIESATVPIFGVDSAGLVNGWNAKVAELTGLQASVAMRKSLVREIVHLDSQEPVDNMLCRALLGEKDKNVELKLRKFGPYEGSPVVYIVANACTSRDYTGNTIGVCFVGQDITSEKVLKDKFIRLEGDYLSILQSPSPFIPPIFAADGNACCSEWNAAMEKLTGWRRHEVIGKVLPGEIFGDMCQLNGQDSLTRFMILLYQGITGQETEKFPFGFSNRDGKYVELHLTSSRRTDAAGNIIGCFCFLQMVQPSLQQSPEAPRQDDSENWKKSKEVAYIQQAIRSPLSGIRFTHKLLETTGIMGHQKQFLQTSDACQRQIMLIIDDLYLRGAREGEVELNAEEFVLGNVLDVIVSQVIILSKERNVQILQEIPEEIKTLSLFGDQIRLQLVMSNFLTIVVHYAPSDCWAEIKISNGLKLIQNGDEFIHLQFRMSHPGHGLPATVIQDMFETGSQWKTQDGQQISLSRRLLNKMNGDVQYRREQTSCNFVVDIELKVNKVRKELFQGETSGTSRTSLHP